MCANKSCPMLSPSKGVRPARHSNNTTPAEYRSDGSAT